MTTVDVPGGAVSQNHSRTTLIDGTMSRSGTRPQSCNQQLGGTDGCFENKDEGKAGGPLPWVSAKTAPASFDMQVPLAANATVPVLPEGFPPPCMYSDTPCLTWQQRPSWRETKFAELRAPHVCDLISRGWDALWHANW